MPAIDRYCIFLLYAHYLNELISNVFIRESVFGFRDFKSWRYTYVITLLALIISWHALSAIYWLSVQTTDLF